MSNRISYRLERYFTVKQVAHCLQVPEDYVRSLVNSGALECITLPGNLDNPVRVAGDSFENFISSCRSKREIPALNQVVVQSAEQKVSQNDCEQQAPPRDSEQQCNQNHHPDFREKKTCLSVFEV